MEETRASNKTDITPHVVDKGKNNNYNCHHFHKTCKCRACILKTNATAVKQTDYNVNQACIRYKA